MKLLLSKLQVDFQDVADFSVATGLTDEVNLKQQSALRARRLVISESLVPVDATQEWLSRISAIRAEFQQDDAFILAAQGLSVIEADHEAEEALSIAVILRDLLQDPDKNAILVTPDPALARRVRARLRRWDVNVDSSAGEPLEETALGVFLSQILRLSGDPTHPLYLADLMAHPLASLGQAKEALSASWLIFEKTVLRGPRPTDSKIRASEWGQHIEALLAPLSNLEMSAPINEWARALCEVAEAFAASDAIAGGDRLWRGEAGEKASQLLSGLMALGARDVATYLTMTRAEFAEMLSLLMRGEVVRPPYGTHPQLQILGPLEARMMSADLVILGGLNEGIWPVAPGADPFLSRDMRQALGLSLPERRYGLAAHDFQDLAMGPEVIITRAKRVDGAPKIASRWVWRLMTLFRGALGEDIDQALAPARPYLDWARALDEVRGDELKMAEAPKPTPPLSARWPLGDRPEGQAISVTKFKTFIRDPYAIYAQYILGLEPLDDLNQARGPADYGNAIHDALKRLFPLKMTGDRAAEAHALKATFLQDLEARGFGPQDFIKEDIRLTTLARAIIDDLYQAYDKNYHYVSHEEMGYLPLPQYGFTIKGKPDRVDQGPDGYDIIDYKTGKLSTAKVVQAGFDPQLPLLALMTEEGAFENIPKGEVSDLSYIQARADFKRVNIAAKMPVSDYLDRLHDTLAAISAMLKDPTAPFMSQIRRQYKNDYGAYDHLARRAEWEDVAGSDEGGTDG